MVADLIPPPGFASVSFATYIPDESYPSQARARELLEGYAAQLHRPVPRRRRRLRASSGPAASGVYLDGGYGVGKTHLLASLWHACPGPKAYGTFVEITNLVGALGFAATVASLAGTRLLAIDEFELDDPGDTMLVSTLLGQLFDRGVSVVATSNTLPQALGEGRFAADDFTREILGLADRFTVVSIDGPDYRHRGRTPAPETAADSELAELAARVPGATLDEFDRLLDHLRELHPVRYGALLDGVPLVVLRGVRTVTDQSVALRLVVLADRLYDRDVALVASGAGWDRVFSEEMLAGGFRKKYRRALSRLAWLAGRGDEVLARCGGRIGG
ncbi:MAG: cell division protein ZapE [Actinomycetes bacterium]